MCGREPLGSPADAGLGEPQSAPDECHGNHGSNTERRKRSRRDGTARPRSRCGEAGARPSRTAQLFVSLPDPSSTDQSSVPKTTNSTQATLEPGGRGKQPIHSKQADRGETNATCRETVMLRRETQVETRQRRDQTTPPGGAAGGSRPATGKAGNTGRPQQVPAQTGPYGLMRATLPDGGERFALMGEALKCVIVYTRVACLLIFLPDRLRDGGLAELKTF